VKFNEYDAAFEFYAEESGKNGTVKSFLNLSKLGMAPLSQKI